jgi:gas vesicle protein
MIFNIGPLEFILILLVAIIVLGPERMVTGARSFGRWIYKLVRSPTWRAIMSTSQEIRDLPNKIMRESGLEETMKDVQSVSSDLNNEISQAVKDVNSEVSQAAIAVSAEVSQAVKDVNAELKQNAQVATQAAALPPAEAGQPVQPVASESQPAEAEVVVPAAQEPTPVTEAIAPTEVGGYDQAPFSVDQPALVMQEISAIEPAAVSNNGHSQENVVVAVAQESPAPEVVEDTEIYQEPVILKVPKVRKSSKAPKAPKAKQVVPPEDENSIQPPESPSAHIKIE